MQIDLLNLLTPVCHRLKITVQSELEGSTSDAVQLKYWQEFVEIPWDAYQPPGSFTYNPATQRYGFQEGYDEGDLADDFLNEPDKEENTDLKKEHVLDKSGGTIIGCVCKDRC